MAYRFRARDRGEPNGTRAGTRDLIRGGVLTGEELQAYLREQIPLAQAMDVRVMEATPQHVVLEAPIEPNLNHRSTAFGGSVVALATLAGWTLVHLGLDAEGLTAQTVIQRSSIQYDAPIHGEFWAACGPVPERDWDRFVRALTKRGRGRVHVPATVEAGGEVVASFQGAYVALRGSTPSG